MSDGRDGAMSSGTAGRRVPVRVELAAGLDPVRWEHRHALGDVPDRTPYGLGRLAGHGFDVDLHTAVLRGPAERVARSVRHRTGGLELAELVRTWGSTAAVVATYDERTGLPALLRHPRTPVVTGIGWLVDPADAHPAQAWLARRLLPRAAAVWVQSRPLLPMLSQHWGVPADRTSFLRFGIDTEFYAPADWTARDQTSFRVFGAGEDRFRDHDLLVAAVRLLRTGAGSAGAGPDVRLDLATSMTTTFTPDLGDLYTARLDGRIRPLYAAASAVAVALHPTPMGSGLSVVLEAMATGRPVVVTANPGIEDYVDDGRTGLLVPPHDVEALAAALQSLRDDPERASAMGAAAAEDVRHRSSSATMAAGLAEILHRVVDERSGATARRRR